MKNKFHGDYPKTQKFSFSTCYRNNFHISGWELDIHWSFSNFCSCRTTNSLPSHHNITQCHGQSLHVRSHGYVGSDEPVGSNGSVGSHGHAGSDRRVAGSNVATCTGRSSSLVSMFWIRDIVPVDTRHCTLVLLSCVKWIYYNSWKYIGNILYYRRASLLNNLVRPAVNRYIFQ